MTRWCRALACFGIVWTSAWAENGAGNLRTLASWMCGSFSSAGQAQRDSAYLDIRLRMSRVWPERSDGYWLYVEQATAWSQEKPYRQRMYRLTYVGADLFRSEVFEFRDPLRCAGAWRMPELLADVTPDSLEAREGCAIILRALGDTFAGSTLGRQCGSALRGAAFATSEVEIKETVLTSWDRGFNASGEQVWGAVEGPYVFEKTEAFPLR